MTHAAAVDRARAAYRRDYGREPSLVVQAPGRVNLIGEHTDYNDGFVLPMALPFAIAIAGEPRCDGRVEATSEGFEPVTFATDDTPDTGLGWATYAQGMAHFLAADGHPIAGWQASIASDIPAGASLSSSAALEIAAGLAFVTAAGASVDGATLARLGQRVENEILGLPSGIMDQLASAVSKAGSAALIDCRDLSVDSVPIPDATQVVIMDTGTRRRLVDSEYAARRADCEVAAGAMGVASLRDASLEQIHRIDDERVLRRARHVLTENRRTLDAAEAMRRGDAAELGRLMNESHRSLRDDYEVSGPAHDVIVELARATDGCFGARMTGGGFAGCAVALVASGHTSEFVRAVQAGFEAPPEQPATEPVRLYAVEAGPGARVSSAP